MQAYVLPLALNGKPLGRGINACYQQNKTALL